MGSFRPLVNHVCNWMVTPDSHVHLGLEIDYLTCSAYCCEHAGRMTSQVNNCHGGPCPCK
uniref:Uncharacterized protein n=1 Tax=Arundo donax TaxID=35708 RepID=A0A0A9GCA2_ARUDO